MSLDLQDPRKTLVVVRIGNQLRAGEGPLSLLRQIPSPDLSSRRGSSPAPWRQGPMPVGRMILMRPSLPGSTTNSVMQSVVRRIGGWLVRRRTFSVRSQEIFLHPRRVIARRVLQTWGCSVEPQRILRSFPDAETRPHLLTLAVTRKKFGATIHGLEPALRHGGCHE